MAKSRQVTDKDRLIDVGGYGVPPECPEAKPEEFFDELADLTLDEYNPGKILVISHSDEDFNLLRLAVGDAGGKKDYIQRIKNVKIAGEAESHHFTFRSQTDAYLFCDCIYGKLKPTTLEEGAEPIPDHITAVVMIGQDTDDHERYLAHVLERCQDLKVYCIRYFSGPTTVGLFPRTDLPGFEAIPVSVNLDAPDDAEREMNPFPVAAMYGVAKEVAEKTACPISYAYLASIAASSTYVEGAHNIRPNIYAGQIGVVHSGKSLAAERVFQLLGMVGPDNTPLTDQLVDSTPASDRGLYRLLPCETPAKPCLLYSDEGRDFMAKANIQGSSLIPVINKLFNSNGAGVADKASFLKLNVRLSVLINLTVKDPDEFSRIFTHETSHGLWDRFLYAVRREKWRYTPWVLPSEFDCEDFVGVDGVYSLADTTQPIVRSKIFDVVHQWAAAGEHRDRLAEIALRVAYVTSAVNRDKELPREAIDAALLLMDWQEEIRRDFQPAKGSNEAEECVKTVLAAFTEANGYKYQWRETAWKRHWYEKFAKTLKMTRRNLLDEGVIKRDKTGVVYLNRETEQAK